MIAFEVKDMTCGHCISTITRALRAVDNQAAINIRLAEHRVEIESTEADAEELSQAISEAGYTPVPVPAAATPAAANVKDGSCCCG